ncbi:hypothetical protein, partial [Deinococcus radiotolerans]|uniref:hypothetical protein n=1 Tax=Deinococcus radiotolerans TaxID=1309407 RepID=UPI001E52CC53
GGLRYAEICKSAGTAIGAPSLLPEIEPGTVDGFYYHDSMEWLFAEERLERLRIQFDGPFRSTRAFGQLQLQWISVLWQRPYQDVLALFLGSGRTFRLLEYTDGTLGLHCFRAPSGLLLEFGADGLCEHFTLEFEDRFSGLGGIRSLTLQE